MKKRSPEVKLLLITISILKILLKMPDNKENEMELSKLLQEYEEQERTDKEREKLDKLLESASKEVENEEYVINLINDLLTDSTTDADNWEFNLDYIRKNYDMISEIEDVNMSYVNSYLEAYMFVRITMSRP